MFIRNFLGMLALAVLVTIGLGCSGDDAVDFSGNVKTTLNVTGNYAVTRTPFAALNNFTITQTNNRVQAIDNTGVVYTGTTPGDITTGVIGSQVVTTAITLQGRDESGVTRTLVLTSITFAVTDPFSTPTTTTDLATAILITGLSGTYTDTAGVAGGIELVTNALQP